jgi:hypothetical protein
MGSMEELKYSINCNFHNLVNVEILTNHEFPAEFFASEYHLSDDISSNLPKLELRVWLSNQILPKSDYVFHTHKGLARWSYRINISNEMVSIEAFGNRAAIPMIHHMLVHPSLRYLVAFRDVILLHAGAVVSQGKSLLFTGRGGAGKTTTTSLILSDGGNSWQMHADDYVFIGPGPTSLAYLTRSHLYRDLLYWVPEIKDRLTSSERLSLELYGRIRAWSQDRIKWPVRLPLNRLWPDRSVCLQANPAALVILDRADVVEPTVQSVDDRTEFIDDLLAMNFFEARHYLSLVEKSKSLINFKDWLDKWKGREAKLLAQRLHEIPINLLYLPKSAKPSKTMKGKLVERLDSMVTQE